MLVVLSVILLAGGVLSWHFPMKRCDMVINVKKAKTRTLVYGENSFCFNELIGYVESTVLDRTFADK